MWEYWSVTSFFRSGKDESIQQEFILEDPDIVTFRQLFDLPAEHPMGDTYPILTTEQRSYFHARHRIDFDVERYLYFLTRYIEFVYH